MPGTPAITNTLVHHASPSPPTTPGSGQVQLILALVLSAYEWRCCLMFGRLDTTRLQPSDPRRTAKRRCLHVY